MNNSTSVTALYEGTFSVGLDAKFIPISRNESPREKSLKLSINPFLIKSDNRNYLIDAGLGGFGEGTSCEIIRENLQKEQLTEYDISDIFLSHLHFDHLGGLAEKCNGFWQLTFPDATIWVSKNDWKQAIGKDLYYDEEKTEFLHFLDAKADLNFLSDQEQPYPDISTRTIGGHSQYHQLIVFDDGSQQYMMAGDVIATRGHVNRRFAAKYDYDADRSMELREELTELAYQNEYTILGYHDNEHPVFGLTEKKERKGYTIEAVEEYVPAE